MRSHSQSLVTGGSFHTEGPPVAFRSRCCARCTRMPFNPDCGYDGYCPEKCHSDVEEGK